MKKLEENDEGEVVATEDDWEDQRDYEEEAYNRALMEEEDRDWERHLREDFEPHPPVWPNYIDVPKDCTCCNGCVACHYADGGKACSDHR